ncbi:MAG: nucleoside triphosphate pyrophosphohydrolase ham1 [Bogoriella megaspora]|nr:MAG: nucleoside triphosphate pyrophosphohydrolase ham1 [Bogoriella megaspora]
MAPRTLFFITGNKNKLAEVKAILGSKVDLQSQSADVPELQGTIEEISRAKCIRAAEIIGGPVLVEDTCLCFDALGELPGPYMYVSIGNTRPLMMIKSTVPTNCISKWFVQAMGPHDLHKLLAGFDDKSAQAICTFVYSEGPGAEPIIFQGRTKGKLVPSRGPTDFGWDSAFEYEGLTYAEMDKSEKNKVSHRSKALAKLTEWLESHVE